MQINFLPVLSAATAVVHPPAAKSNTKSPGLEYVFISHSITSTGFCVGCIRSVPVIVLYGISKIVVGYRSFCPPP